MSQGAANPPDDPLLTGDGDAEESAGDEPVDPVEAAADDLPLEELDWHIEHHHRRLMRKLHDAVARHIADGDFVASSELEIAMTNVKSELDWD